MRLGANSTLRLAGSDDGGPVLRRDHEGAIARLRGSDRHVQRRRHDRQIARHLDEQDRIAAVTGGEHRRRRDGRSRDEDTMAIGAASELVVAERGGGRNGRRRPEREIGPHGAPGDGSADGQPDPGLAVVAFALGRGRCRGRPPEPASPRAAARPERGATNRRSAAAARPTDRERPRLAVGGGAGARALGRSDGRAPPRRRATA